MRVLAILLSSLAALTVHADEQTVVRPADTGAALVNPGMGWTMHFYSNHPENYGSKLEASDTLEDFPGLSVVYLRLPWAYLEPDEGQFNWAVLDTPAQRWIAKGRRVALRLTCSENWMKYATPEWVARAGAKGTFYEYGKGPAENGPSWDPMFDDPVFLQKLDAFLAAAAARYDGNPNVAFIDIGSFGMWGEGHTHGSSRQDKFEIQKQHIDLHLKHFKKTLLCISDDYAGHNKPGREFPITDYAFSRGVTIRDDSILVQPPPDSWYHAEMAEKFRPVLPVILEHEHYGASRARGAWKPELLLKAVEDYHASYLSIHWWPRILLDENREVVDRINRRMGYRLHPVEVAWPAAIRAGERFTVRWAWRNSGVAPCLPGAFPALTLKDAKGGLVSVLSDETLDLKTLRTGPPGEAPATTHESVFRVALHAPVTPPGVYDLFVSAGLRDGTPTIALPLKDDDGQRRYRLGSITLEGKTAAGK